MKKIFNTIIVGAAALALSSCSDFLDRKSSAYDSDGFYLSDAGMSDGVTGVYRLLQYNQNWDVPQIAMQDVYSPYGLQAEENNTIGAGAGLTPDQSYVTTYWAGHWAIVARANNVITGAKTDPNDMSDVYKRRLAEAYFLRDYAYYNLVQAFGDIPFFTRSVTPEQYHEPRTDKTIIADQMIKELTAIAESGVLPWQPEQLGRTGNGAVWNLIARWALLAGSHNFGDKGSDYFKTAANAAKQVMDNTGLASNYGDLFTHAGQAKGDVRKEILWEYSYADGSVRHTHRTRYGHTSRTAGGSSVRFPSTMLAVCFECTDGKRIDESPLFDPKQPQKNRDPRFRHTILMHADTFVWNNGNNKCVLNVYDQNSRQFPNPRNKKNWYSAGNVDVTGTGYSFARQGVGYLWNKYNEDLTEGFAESTIDLIVMRAAEAYLTYAEAKIELGEMDESVYKAINDVRHRAGMPDFDEARKGNQDKMRQIVRRERKVELAMEGVLVTDFRRWGIGDILNAEPTYGQPIAEIGYEGLTKADMPTFTTTPRHDLNDVPVFEAVKDKYTMRDAHRCWAERFQWWPIPRADLDRNPNLSNPPGY